MGAPNGTKDIYTHRVGLTLGVVPRRSRAIAATTLLGLITSRGMEFESPSRPGTPFFWLHKHHLGNAAAVPHDTVLPSKAVGRYSYQLPPGVELMLRSSPSSGLKDHVVYICILGSVVFAAPAKHT
eukprot:COSAG01_NODE_4633_length_4853_cov_6.538332_6_plen_126_part_00